VTERLFRAAEWTSAPFLAMALLSPIGGWFSDRIANVTDRRTGRVAAFWVGMGIAAVLLYAGNHLHATAIALPMIALAAGFTMFGPLGSGLPALTSRRDTRHRFLRS